MYRVKIRLELDLTRLPQIMKNHREILEIPETQGQVRFQLSATRHHFQGNMIKILTFILMLLSDWLRFSRPIGH